MKITFTNLILCLTFILTIACKKSNTLSPSTGPVGSTGPTSSPGADTAKLYSPPTTGTTWETASAT